MTGASTHVAAARPRLLHGWGGTSQTRSDVASPRSPGEVQALLESAGPRGAVARGLGRAYGDAAQNAGGLSIDTTGLDGLCDLDPECGMLTVAAGVSLDWLMRRLVPQGWFVPVTPGTRQVTIGGAIACDIHGKNHHRDGPLGRHLEWMEVATPSGGLQRMLPRDEGFAATTGGMGLTGVITSARLRLLPIRTTAMRVTTERAADLDDLLARMAEGDDEHRYSVAWIDCLARGRRLGRGVLTRGDHAEPEQLPPERRPDPLVFSPRPLVRVPAWAPPGLLNRPAMRAFNAAWYHKAPRRAISLETLAGFFHPLDGIRDWNRLYGPRGMIQYQAVLPFGEEDALRSALERFGAAGAASFLAVLKRFGPGAGLLSFPAPGWTFALDFPAGLPGLGPLLDGIDETVAGAGGRVYLAKDSRLRPELLGAMYPELDAWRRIQSRLDPEGAMSSDLARRLDLLAAPA